MEVPSWNRIPTVKLEIPGKTFLKFGQKRCFSQFFHGRFKVKNYNMNVTEVRDLDFKNVFSRNFQFHRQDPTLKLTVT